MREEAGHASAERLTAQINLARPDWEARAQAVVAEYLARVPEDLGGGFVRVTVAWEAVPGLWGGGA